MAERMTHAELWQGVSSAFFSRWDGIGTFPRRAGDLLIVGLRGYHFEQGWNENTRDVWNDSIAMLRIAPEGDAGAPQVKVYEATTDPGRFKKLYNIEGDFWLEPGCYKIRVGWHGKNVKKNRPGYEAFNLYGAGEYSRDKDKDGIPGEQGEMSHEPTDNLRRFGINLHHSKDTKGRVGNWSAGCQVVRHRGDLAQLLRYAKDSQQERISYLLLTEENF